MPFPSNPPCSRPPCFYRNWRTISHRISLSLILTLVLTSVATAPVWGQPAPLPNRHSDGEIVTQGISSPSLVALIQRYNPQLDRATALDIANWTMHYSQERRINPALIVGLVARESSFNPNATSRSGARGLGQLSQALVQDLNIRDAYDVRQNLDGTTLWLRQLYDIWLGEGVTTEQATAWALASYRQGLGGTRRQGISPTTADYINEIYEIAHQIAE